MRRIALWLSSLACGALHAMTPQALIDFDTRAVRTEADGQQLLAAVMPTQRELDKRAWLIDTAAQAKPALTSVAQRTLTFDLLGSSGIAETCANALSLETNTALHTTLDSNGSTRSIAWLRITSDATRNLALSTLGSTLDAQVSVYPSCKSDFIASSDDAIGLQALTAFPKGRGELYVKVENLGPRGNLVLQSVLANIVQGKITRRDNGAPIENLRALAFDANNQSLGNGLSNASGDYSIAINTATAQPVFVKTTYASFSGLINFAPRGYNDVACLDYSSDLSDCFPALLTPMPFDASGTVAGINFRLAITARLIVKVSDANSNPIPNALVQSIPSPFGNARTDATGTVVLDRLLPDISYRISAEANGFIRTVFANAECPSSCNPSLVGTPLILLSGETRSISMALRADPSESGGVRVLFNPMIPPESNSFARLHFYYPNGSLAFERTTFGGQVTSLSGIPAGSYYLAASNDSSRSKLYPDVTCTTNCIDQFASASLLSLPLPPGTVVTMTLDLYPTISGRVISTDNQPVDNAILHFYRNFTTFQATTNAAGNYTSPPMPPGQYLIRVTSPAHQDTVYPNQICNLPTPLQKCAAAQTLQLMNALTGIDFAIIASAKVTGRLSGARLNSNNSGAVAVVGSDQGVLAIQEDGQYSLSDLPPGQFRIGAQGNFHFAQIYPGINCSQAPSNTPFERCPASAGQVLTASPGQTLANINFPLKMRGVSGRIVRLGTAIPISGVAVDAWRAEPFLESTSISGVDGSFTISPFSSLSLYLSTDTGGRFLEEVYNNILCPNGSAYAGLCNVTNGQLIDARPWLEFPDTAPLLIELSPRNEALIFANGFE